MYMDNLQSDMIPIEIFLAEVAKMQAQYNELSADYELLVGEKHPAEIAKMQAAYDELTAKYDWLLEKYLLKVKKVFGRSREMVDGQTIMEGAFDEAEAEADTTQPEPTADEVTEPARQIIRKYVGQKKDKLEGIPVERIDYDLPEEKRNCDKCGEPLPELQPNIRRRIEVIPAQIKVLEEVRHVYADCSKCKKDDEDGANIVNAPMPESAVPHSIAAESTIAYVIIQKYQFGLPLYRQEAQWQMVDLRISRQTMANWVILATDMWLKLIYDRMHQILVQRDIIMADESTLQVLCEKDRLATAKSFMWLFRSGRDGPPIVLFYYHESRAAKVPEKFLNGFSGYLCSDGYKSYYCLPSVINVSCFAHARRRFYDALMSIPFKARNKTSAAYIGLQFCDKLFAVERTLNDKTTQERFDERLKLSQPILNEFKKWLLLMSPNTVNKSHFGVAVRYCLDYWDTLCNFMKDGRLDISNNQSISSSFENPQDLPQAA
jgi:transposase